jgi:hypothetical protein
MTRAARIGFLLVAGAGVLVLGALAVAVPSVSSPGEDARRSMDRGGLDRPIPGGPAWSDPIEVARGEAYQGPWRMNASDFRYVDAPSVHVNDTGVVGVAWVDQARKDVLLQLYDETGAPLLEAPTNVSRSPDTFSWLPRLLVSDDDPLHVHVLWQEIVFSGGSHGGEIFFARSSDGGRSFDRPQNLSRTPAGAGKGRLTRDRWDNGSLDLVRGPGGTIFAAWTEYEGALRVTRSEDDGMTFQEPITLVERGGTEPARAPALAVGPSGTVHVAWTVGEDRGADIRVSRSDDGGRSFTTERTPFASPHHADAPALAVDPGGRVHLVYGEAPDGPFGSYRVRHAQWPEDGDPEDGSASRVFEPTPGGYEAGGFPRVEVDGQGRVFVVWELFPDRRRRPLGLALTWSDDGGRSFHPFRVVPGTGHPDMGFNGSLQGMLSRKLFVNAQGRIAVVNGTFNPGRSSRVRLIRGTMTTPDSAANPGGNPLRGEG